jgi:hypothetical protein
MLLKERNQAMLQFRHRSGFAGLGVCRTDDKEKDSGYYKKSTFHALFLSKEGVFTTETPRGKAATMDGLSRAKAQRPPRDNQ